MEGYFSQIVNRLGNEPINNWIQPERPAIYADQTDTLDDPFEVAEQEIPFSEGGEMPIDNRQTDYGFSDLFKPIEKKLPPKITPLSKSQTANPPQGKPMEEKAKKLEPITKNTSLEKLDSKKQVLQPTAFKQKLEQSNKDLPNQPTISKASILPNDLAKFSNQQQEIFDKTTLIQKKEIETIHLLEKRIQSQDKVVDQQQKIAKILPTENLVEQPGIINQTSPSKKLIIGNLKVEVIIPQKEKNRHQPARTRQRPAAKISINGSNLGNKSRFGLGQL